MLANFLRIIELFAQKIVTMLSKTWVLGSRKNLFRIPDPGVKKAPVPDPEHWPHELALTAKSGTFLYYKSSETLKNVKTSHVSYLGLVL
jgi:hypothetical protein